MTFLLNRKCWLKAIEKSIEVANDPSVVFSIYHNQLLTEKFSQWGESKLFLDIKLIFYQ